VLKNNEFRNKLNWIIKIWGVSPVKMIHFTQIFRWMDQNVVWTYKYVWAITKVIFKYTSSPGEKIPRKVFGATFLTHTVENYW